MKSTSRRFGLPGLSWTPTERPLRSCRRIAAIIPSVVGSSAGISASKPTSRRARTGLGPRAILRVVRSASRKAGSRSMRRARPSSRRRPSPVINTRSSHVPFTNQRSQAATGSASGASRMAIIGQGMASAPRSSSIRTSLAKFPGFRHYNSPSAQLFRHARSLRTCARALLNIVSSHSA
jgi:hypothetical protein